MRSVVTRFRAYQLGSPGSSFSYFADGHFTVIEGRLTELSLSNLVREMEKCNVTNADELDITSWDADHCACGELEALLDLIAPSLIQCPGYDPHSESAEKCLKIIQAYEKNHRRTNRQIAIEHITPAYISSLSGAERLAFNNIYYHPRWIDEECNNNNSSVKLFRRGSFNVLSLGDVESSNIAGSLRRSTIACRETDVMILAHHGADNGFTTKKFLANLDPQLAICSSDYDNQHGHPDDAIRDLLDDADIRLMTTKTGDILVKSIGEHTGRFRAINYKGDTTDVSSMVDFTAKKARLLSYNDDTLRQLYAKRPQHPRR